MEGNNAVKRLVHPGRRHPVGVFQTVALGASHEPRRSRRNGLLRAAGHWGMFLRVLDTITQRKIKIGACAWCCDDWRGVFYPEHLPQNQWLGFYARHFPAIEVDSTFYRLPGVKAVARWIEQTPDDFRFACKMPGQITHEMRLRGCGEKVAEFLEGIEPLRTKLGCVLIQLPPAFTPRQDEQTLKDFLAALPPSIRFAIEFRHADWHLPHIVHYLEDRRICWVWSDTTNLDEQNLGAFEPLPQTTDFIDIRLLGSSGAKHLPSGGKIRRPDNLPWPRDSSLENWAIKIQKHLADSERVFLFCSNHFEGFAPLTCRRVGGLLDVRIELPAVENEPPSHEKQMKLL